jgi:putative SOS response-associated peptidase YedK
MPVIVPPAAYAEWLDPQNHDVARLDRLLGPEGAGPMTAYPVSRMVSNARNQGPHLIERVDEPAQAMTLDLTPAPDNDHD